MGIRYHKNRFTTGDSQIGQAYIYIYGRSTRNMQQKNPIRPQICIKVPINCIINTSMTFDK